MTGRILFGVMAETIADNSSGGYCVLARVLFIVFQIFFLRNWWPPHQEILQSPKTSTSQHPYCVIRILNNFSGGVG